MFYWPQTYCPSPSLSNVSPKHTKKHLMVDTALAEAEMMSCNVILTHTRYSKNMPIDNFNNNQSIYHDMIIIDIYQEYLTHWSPPLSAKVMRL